MTQFFEPYMKPEFISWLFLNLGKIIGILIGARILIQLGRGMIERLFAQSMRSRLFGEAKRLETLKVLSLSIVTYGIYFMVILMVLGVLGVNTASIIASAGIVGLAVGFGAQSLVKDVITGFFMIFENYFTVGDYIQAAGVGGIVEEMGLRTTTIRDWAGELHIIPNSQITIVTNFSRGKSRALVDVRISYKEDIDRAIEVLQKEADQVAKEFKETIVEAPRVLGVQDLGSSEVLIRVIAFTQALEQWPLERELRKRLKGALDQAGIEIPSPAAKVVY
ncbi:mechanosensitive ion channel family protein [Dehalobacterium formicoaceticum]|uniref:Mechanosensitive ion channel family protein n=1 Tax=Dehalobacterium formicoaceticum TaxID=51515 RepID=A0ABT1Y3V1_9FIRM|nr:mechanosensitive ion channel family protein [Dehalobacterium formicoaceticum]MCR6545552.1 mechanosensitive ion channel family protein [Dehalobacterium formicoaceticum]